MKLLTVMGIGVVVLVSGCSDNGSGPGTATGDQALVRVTASATGGSGLVTLGKSQGDAGTAAAIDSIQVDHALIVLKDIAFKGGIDTVRTKDSLDVMDDDDHESEYEQEHGENSGYLRMHGIHFGGPFLVVLEDTTPVQVALDTIPPGTYNGIKFKIHKLRSKDLRNNPMFPDSLVGYSIAVAGRVKYASGGWTPFVFKADIDEEFKARGNFVVNPGDRLVPYALKFNLASWFTTPGGRILDPNDWMDRRFIRFMIKSALKDRLWCGRDDNHDGNPD